MDLAALRGAVRAELAPSGEIAARGAGGEHAHDLAHRQSLDGIALVHDHCRWTDLGGRGERAMSHPNGQRLTAEQLVVCDQCARRVFRA